MIRIKINSEEGKEIVELLRMYPENRKGFIDLPKDEMQQILDKVDVNKD